MPTDPLFPLALPLPERIARQIDAGGPVSVAHYMAGANAHYYATRDPLGVAGDFTTAPEISQMFGELCGLWLADLWMRSGRRPDPLYVEFGPGRGTLASDALRAMEMAALAPRVHFIETSPVLRERQRAVVPHGTWHDDLDTIPDTGTGPLLVVANEFFDALPVRQVVRTEAGWRERVLVNGDGAGAFVPIPGYRPMDSVVPAALRDAPVGSVLESCPAGATIGFALANRIMRQGGGAVIIDYGYLGPALGDTVQAVRAHAFADPWVEPGASDLTAHVDFGTLGNVARQAGLRVHGPVGQGAFLSALGIDARATSLAARAPERTDEIEAARVRLTEPDAMGSLFQVMAVVHPDWATPEGFA